MKPGKNGEVILEGDRDRRYVRAAARVTGNEGLARELDVAVGTVFRRLCNKELSMVSTHRPAPPISLSRHELSDVISDQEMQVRGGRERAAERLQTAEVPLDPAATPDVMSGLQAVASMGRLSAAARFVSRSVAQGMLENFSQMSTLD